MLEGGWGGRILVTRCHGGGRGAEVAGWARGAPGVRDVESGALGRFSVGSVDALVIVCVRGCGRGEDQGEVGLRRNCELGSPGCESWSYGARERNP
jgi:hypothetical protein